MQQVARPLTLSVALAALLAFSAPSALAQEQPTAPPSFSDEEISAFAEAAIEVQEVQMELEAKLQNAQDAEEVAQFQQEAQEQATGALEGAGLSTEEYSAIAEAANQDPDLYAAIVDEMQAQSPQ